MENIYGLIEQYKVLNQKNKFQIGDMNVNKYKKYKKYKNRK